MVLAVFACASYGQDVVINEFMAVNTTNLMDQNGEYSDWIELQNVSSNIINLNGWNLTDKIDDLRQWSFPATNIGPGKFILVFASGKNRAVSGQQLHTNFKLTGNGEYLGLIRPDGATVEYAYDPMFPPQVANISYGLCTNVPGGFGYFTNATPGLTNKLGYLDLVADTKFEPDRGLYTNPIVVSITCVTDQAQIRYTTDTEVPSVTSQLYTTALSISNCTALRVEAYKSGLLPSGKDAQTYIFIDKVLCQSNTPAGNYPATWVGYAADYAMDSVIINDPVYGPMMTNTMKSLPSLFIVTTRSNLFNVTNGLYLNTDGTTETWERPATIAWVGTNNKTLFQIDCGLRIQGGAFRSPSIRKHSFRVLFKSDYGPSKLNCDLFDDPTAVKSFDTLIFRAGANDSWSWSLAGAKAQYIVDEFTRRSHIAMGQPSPHGTFVHLYLNELYWGVYNAVEKPAESFAEAYFGIPKTNCDVISVGQAIEGYITAWNTLVAMCNAGVSDNTSYQKIQGNDADGTRNPAYPDYLDVDNYIDYVMVRMWTGDTDWPHNNWQCFRTRDNATSTGFKFAVWDAESGVLIWNDVNTDRTGASVGVCQPYAKLLENAEFRLRFADHIQKFFFNDGALTTSQALRRYQTVAELAERGIVAESARWGDTTGTRYTLNEWRAMTNTVMTTFLPYRSAVVLQQFRNCGLYPSIDAPVLNHHGGSFTNGFQLTLTASNSIYYTLDSRDPREYGTGSAVGTLYTGPITLSNSVLVRARAFISASQWSALDEAYFVLEEPCPLRVTEIMYNPRNSTSTNYTTSDYEFIEFKNTGDKTIGLAGVKFTDGINFDFTITNAVNLAPQTYAVIVENLAAFKSRYSNWASINIIGEFQRYREFPIANLDDNGEKIEIEDALGSNILSFTYSDGRDWPQAADGAGHSLIPLVQDNSQTNNGLLDWGGNWRASAFIDGSPGEADDEPVVDILLNEIMAHTDYTNEAHPDYDSDDWIEIYNTTASPMSLTNWYLSDDAGELKKWQIPATNTIAGKGWLWFDEVTGFHSPITNGFGLFKGGEQVFLSYLPGNSQDRVVDSVTFKGQSRDDSLGRYPDGDDYWYELALTPGTTNALPGERVIISEIMYHPSPTVANPEDNTNDEYIELYNQGKESVTLMWEGGAYRIDGGVEYTFPSNTVMGPGTTILLVSFDPETNLVAKTNFLAAYDLQYTPVLMGPYDGKLSNEGERIALEKPQLPDLPGESVSWIIVDEVIYSVYSPWPAGADGTGFSITRLPGIMSGNNPASWTLPLEPSPGLGPARMVLTRPEYGMEYLTPFSLTVHVEVDTYSVSGSVHKVEFFDGANSIYVDTNGVPYECVFSRTNNEGSHTFSAVLTDDGGAFTSAATMVSVVGPMSVYNTGVSNITDISAAPNGLFTGVGIDYGTVTLYWGDTDGTSNKGSWAHSEYLGRKYTNGTGGLVVTNIYGLQPNKVYYYRWYVTRAQGEKWSDSTASFMSHSYTQYWSHKMKVMFNGYTGTDTLTNFPVLVVLNTNMTLFSYGECQAGGTDIRFSDSEETNELSYEVESWNSLGKSYVWVKVPELTPGSDYVWIYWGHPIADKYPVQATNGTTWSGGYRGVWHLNDRFDDSTSNRTETVNHDTTGTNTLTANGRVFSGTNQYIEIRIPTNWYGANMNNMTVSMWMKSKTYSGYSGTLFGEGDGTNRPLHIKRRSTTVGWVEFGVNNGTNALHKWASETWVYVNMVLKNGQAYGWSNDVVKGPFVYTPFTPAYEPHIGYMNGQTTDVYYFMGIIDEVRVAGEARSADWIKAEYKNVTSNNVFVSFEAPPEPPPPELPPPPDNDADSMADTWETVYFGGTNVTDGGPTNDWDHDGIDNESEYIAGTCPTSANSLFMLTICYTNGKLAVMFPALEPGTNHYGGYDRLYSLENNTNLTLGLWTGIPNYTNIPGADQTVSYTNTINPRSFFRAKVKLQ